MVFSSIIFLFLYLPVVLALYYLLFTPVRMLSRRFGIKLGNILLLVSSLFFYTWGENLFVCVMMFSTLVDYVCGLVISGGFRARGRPIEALTPGGSRTAAQRAALVTSVVANLSILGFFKYFNFGMDNVNAVATALGWDWLYFNDVIQVTLPLGVSFYTFQSLSYTIDVYRGATRATRDFIDFACFVTLFPQLVAGPIVRYRDLAAQLVNRTINSDGFAYGVSRFIIGLGKKVLIANTMAVAADGIFAIPDDELTTGLAWLGVFCYHFQIFFDFSGYSDMAIGLGKMFGFTFLENFNYPYISKSIKEFWRRWHMSLSRWFMDYLYLPLGGNRVSQPRIYLNLVIVFFLCGLWHGAAWTFILFGLYHGIFLVIERMGLERLLTQSPRVVQYLYMLAAVLGGWVIFRSDNMTRALDYYGVLFGNAAEGAGKAYYVDLYLRSDLCVAFVAAILFSVPTVPWLLEKSRNFIDTRKGAIAVSGLFIGHLGRWAVLCLILFACAMSLSSGTHNPFIYFRF